MEFCGVSTGRADACVKKSHHHDTTESGAAKKQQNRRCRKRAEAAKHRPALNFRFSGQTGSFTGDGWEEFREKRQPARREQMKRIGVKILSETVVTK